MRLFFDIVFSRYRRYAGENKKPKGAMLIEKEAIEIVSGIISKDDFCNRQLGMIFEMIVELNQEGHAGDFEMLQNRLSKTEMKFGGQYEVKN